MLVLTKVLLAVTATLTSSTNIYPRYGQSTYRRYPVQRTYSSPSTFYSQPSYLQPTNIHHVQYSSPAKKYGYKVIKESYQQNVNKPTLKTSPLQSSFLKIASLSPRTDFQSKVNAQVISQQVLSSPFLVKFTTDQANSPTAKAALSYLKNAILDSCGEQSKVYIETILAGGSPAEANAKAAEVYIKNYNAGSRPASGSACEESDIAFRKAVRDGEDPILASALAFVKSNQSDSPCAVSATDYIQAILNGSENPDLIAAKSFAQQIEKLSSQGKPTFDKECAASAQSFSSSSSNIPSSPNAAALQAFISKALETGNGFDPVCYKAAERYFESFESGKEELASTFVAARDFLKEYKNSPLPATQSPCAAATKAYAKALKTVPSDPNQKALLAFIDEAVFSNDDGIDPVCGASAEAYFDAYIAGADEAAASEAAAIAYIEAVADNSDFDAESPCGRAAQAFIDNY